MIVIITSAKIFANKYVEAALSADHEFLPLPYFVMKFKGGLDN